MTSPHASDVWRINRIKGTHRCQDEILSAIEFMNTPLRSQSVQSPPTKRNMLIIPLDQNLWGICGFSAKQIFQGCNYLFPKRLMRVLPKTKISKLRNHVPPKSYILKFENHGKTYSLAEIIGLQKGLGCDVTTPNPPHPTSHMRRGGRNNVFLVD